MVGPSIAMCCSIDEAPKALHSQPTPFQVSALHPLGRLHYRIVFIEAIDGEPSFFSGLPLSLPLPSAAGRPICWRESVLSEHPSEAAYFTPDRLRQLPSVTLRKERVSVGRVSLYCLRAACVSLHETWR